MDKELANTILDQLKNGEIKGVCCYERCILYVQRSFSKSRRL